MAEETPKQEQAAPVAAPEQAAPLTLGAVETKPAPQPITAPPLPAGVHYIWGTGRRKKAVARVRIRPGTGKIIINKRERVAFFPDIRDQNTVITPLQVANMLGAFDVFANVNGGGYAGQAGAVSLGLARAMCRAAPDVEAALRDHGLLTRDARMKERKKYGQKGARKRFQFSKR